MKIITSSIVLSSLVFLLASCSETNPNQNEVADKIPEPEVAANFNPENMKIGSMSGDCSTWYGQGGFLVIELHDDLPKLELVGNGGNQLSVEWGNDPANRYKCTCDLDTAGGSGGVNLKITNVAPLKLFIADYKPRTGAHSSKTIKIDAQETIAGFIHTDENYYFIGIEDARDAIYDAKGHFITIGAGFNMNMMYVFANGVRKYTFETRDVVSPINDFSSEIKFGEFNSKLESKTYLEKILE